MVKKTYPLWKVIAWRYWRVFFSSFLVQFFALLGLLDSKEILGDSLVVGPFVFLKSLWLIALYPALLSGVIAGLSALGKYLRENKDFDMKVHKLPI